MMSKFNHNTPHLPSLGASRIARMPSAPQVAAATPGPWKIAATEHDSEVLLIQSTKMSINVELILTFQDSQCHREDLGQDSR